MSNIATLPLHKKLKQIRTAKGLSQHSLGSFLGRNTKYVSRIENGETQVTPDVLARILKFMDVETAPLFDNELSIYKSRLWVWRDVIVANRIEEAQNMQKGLSVILSLPFEQDLIIMYKMIESRLFVIARNMSAIQERIESATPHLDEMSTDALHLYHYIAGIFNFMQTAVPFTQTMDSESRSEKEILTKALEHFTLSLDYERQSAGFYKDASLQAFIGNTYTSLGKPVRALISLERSLAAYSGDYAIGIRKMGASIATCHFHIGDYEQAKNAFEEVLLHEQAVNNRIKIALVLSDLALTNLMLGNHDEALRQCEEAFSIAKEDDLVYLICLSCKIKIFMKIKKTAAAKALVAEGKQLATGEKEIVRVVFEAFGHLMSLSSDKSIDYLENIAIPCLRGTAQNHIALEICSTLEEHFRKKEAKYKTLAMAALGRDIYRDMIVGH